LSSDDCTFVYVLARILNEVLPLPQLQHLKRVRSSIEDGNGKVQILLCETNVISEHRFMHKTAPECAKLLSLLEHDIDVDTSIEDNLLVCLVAEVQPKTRKQFETLRASIDYWPVNFHPDKYLENKLSGEGDMWSKEAVLRIEKFFELCRNNNGGIILDPNDGSIVASGAGICHISKHPLQHAAMVLADLVARSQGGGAWCHTSNTPDLEFVKKTVPNADCPPSSELPLHLSQVPTTGPYLCTGYDVYLWQEPCHMCSMALIHMRTRRLIFCKQTSDGALITVDKLHTREELNHRFEVYQVEMDDSKSGIFQCS